MTAPAKSPAAHNARPAPKRVHFSKIKEGVDLRDIVRADGAKLIGGGRWKQALCPLPGHDERKPSFSCNEERFRCHGCGEAGDVFDYLKLTRGLDPMDAAAFLTGGEAGAAYTPVTHKAARERREIREREEAEDRQARIMNARSIWRRARELKDPVAAYLTARGIDMDALGGPPSCMRYHPGMYHPETGLTAPAIVTPFVSSKEAITAVHVTFIRRDASGKADFEPNKKVMGDMGDAALRLFNPPSTRLILTEGIENALTLAARAHTLGAAPRIWAAGNLGQIKKIVPPPGVEKITIGCDAETLENGVLKPHVEEVYREAAARFGVLGVKDVKKIYPDLGGDFNDMDKARDKRRREDAS